MANAPLCTLVRQLRGLVDPHPSEAATDGQLLERFTVGREEEAFAGLLRRHGPMVLGVCRRVLGHAQDAEDVFQATFLLLARKSGSIRQGEAVSGWLHAVASRLALKARARAAQQRRRERQAAARRTPTPDLKSAWQELEAALDDEVQRLPPAFRAPLVHCYLEGQTQEEASRRLGCPLGTVRSRLARARQLLRDRLARRGLVLSAAALTTALAATPASALPAPLFDAALKAGLLSAAGQTVTGSVSARTAALVDEGLRAMAVGKLKIAVLLFLLGGLLATAAVVVARRALADSVPAAQASDRGPKAPVKPEPAADRADEKPVTITGQVLAADGKPVPQAVVGALAHFREGKTGALGENLDEVLGNTRTDGRGRFRLSLRGLTPARLQSLELVAAAAGHGLGWRAITVPRRAEAVLRLWPEQVLRCRLVDLQGQPAARVKVHLIYVANPRARGDAVGLGKAGEKLTPWPKPVTTDAQGRFVLRGLGRDLAVGLHIHDERFGRQDLHRVPTRDGKEVTLLLAAPQVVEGRVTFKDSGKPVPGARLLVEGQDRAINKPTFQHGTATGRTDGEGRFRLVSYPGNHVHITVLAPEGTPYLGVETYLPWPKGAVKQQVQLALPRGILVRGRVTEAGSGKPVAGVRVEFWPRRRDNPAFQSAVTGWGSARVSAADGRFSLAVLPAAGYLLCQSSDRNYIQQTLYRNLNSGKITTGPVVYPNDPTVKRADQLLYPDGQHVHVDGWHELNLKPEDKSPVVKMVLRRGVTVQGRLLGPDGKPVARANMLCRLPVGAYGFVTLGTVEVWEGCFTLTGCDPNKTYPVFFLDAEHQWGAVARVSARQAGKKPVTVRLAPCGSALVRVRNRQGQAVANYSLNIHGLEVLLPPATSTGAKGPKEPLPRAESVRLYSLDMRHYGGRLQTDGRGEVVLPALIPGATYQVNERGHVREFKVEAGKQVKLEDLIFN
jgi:RNA polymerase sigma factor (sigma-70 family)